MNAVISTEVEFDLDTMVPGEENVLALTGALRALEEPGERYNPLFVFGPPSAGKTHLLYGLRRRLEERHPHWNILALPAGEFLEECEQAWHCKQVVEFRQQLWQLNALLIDDVHLLLHRPAALEEVYHTFNRLLADSKQFILTSRYAPAEMNDLPLSLRSRFQSGLVVHLEAPREQLMRDIIEQRCEICGIRPTRDAASFLSRELRSVRELLGIVHHLEQALPHNGEPRRVSLSEVRSVLEKHTAERTSIPDIARVCCQYFNVELSKVRSASRQQAFVQARQLAMYLSRELTNAPLTEIGAFFGGRDHTTVLYACRKVAAEIRQSSFTARAAKEIRCILRG